MDTAKFFPAAQLHLRTAELRRGKPNTCVTNSHHSLSVYAWSVRPTFWASENNTQQSRKGSFWLLHWLMISRLLFLNDNYLGYEESPSVCASGLRSCRPCAIWRYWAPGRGRGPATQVGAHFGSSDERSLARSLDPGVCAHEVEGRPI